VLYHGSIIEKRRSCGKLKLLVMSLYFTIIDSDIP
jgi:hypothetical protein